MIAHLDAKGRLRISSVEWLDGIERQSYYILPTFAGHSLQQ
jgi:hypothetical protein